jgi:uncharacterized protein (DUF885 family)
MRSLLLAVSLPNLFFAHPVEAASEDEKFEQVAHAYLEHYLETDPEQATALGDHRFDDRLSDYSSKAIGSALESEKDFLKTISLLDLSRLTGADRIDARILKENIEASIFHLDELKEHKWNPLVYNESLANSLYLLVVRDFGPAPGRVANLRKRMDGISAIIEQAKTNLKNPPRIHTETAIEQTDGAISLVREGLNELLDQVPESKEEISPLQEKTAKALEGYRDWLKNDLLPGANGDFRIGESLFRKKLSFALSSDLSMEEIKSRATADLAATQSAIYETALPLYKKYFPSAEPAALGNKRQVVKSVLDKLAEQHPTNETIVAKCEEAVRETTNFVKERHLVTLPDKPLKVIVMPEFKRGTGLAYCDAPGPLEAKGETFFAVEPTPKTWSKERADSFYREYNNFMIQDLAVHEAMPGHFLQLAHANQFHAPSLVRAIFHSGTFVEGWAVYTEQLMAEQGHGGPEVKMQQLKMRLRAIVNALLDQGIHAGKMTEKDAIDLMMNEGFQQEGEAVAKWKRARLTSAQLSTYFVGVSEMLDLRARAQAKAGKDFDLAKYHDEVISFGSPAPKYVAELLGL